MINPERLSAFINAMDAGNEEWLDELEHQSLDAEVPIIRKDTQSLLRFLLTLQNPHNILEVGCAVGFSALLMARYSRSDCKITTIEKYEKRISVAKANFAKYDKEEKISLLEGDAADFLAELVPGYDFIFMDAAKAQYIHYLPDLVRLLSMNGVLLSDNVLQEGDIIESKYAVIKRNRTIHARMREYLYALKNHEQLMTSVLTIGDGVTLSVKTDCMNF